MNRFAIVLAFFAIAIGSARAEDGASQTTPAKPPTPSVQIALLLDTSGSMEGLLSQAKSQLWKIVNEFVKAKQNGKPPTIQVALYEYGKATLSPEEGYVRQILPMTDDLDKVSEELFALKTNGGEEYCGWVIRDAAKNLQWSTTGDVYKAIFIAGNEPFSQGPVDFHASCRSAIEKGIVVNTIFCGPSETGISTQWKDGATLADGRYLSIDQNQKLVEIVAPQDTEIARLGVDLNKTYLPYGKLGQAGSLRQAAQDVNAMKCPEGLTSRSISKANSIYCNDAWDLVDAIKNGKAKLEELKDDELPEALKKLDKNARKAKVEEASKQRSEIQARILSLTKDREQFVEAERKKQSAGKDDTLEQAIAKAIREQATRCNLKFD